jgi:PD-(D/E)XK nuclease superfamily protein
MTSAPIVLPTLELEPHPNKRFMVKFERYEPKVKSSTMLRTWMECPRKYFLQVVLGYVTKEDAIYLTWGSAYHLFRYVLEFHYGIGDEATQRFDPEKGKIAFGLASEQALKFWKANMREPAAGTKWEFMTTERLLKSFVAAYKHWQKEKEQGRIRVIAIEQACNVQLGDGSYTSIRADQIIRWNGKIWGRDWKSTTKNSDFYKRSLEPNDQFTRYTFVEGQITGESVQGQFVELLYNAKPTKNKTNGPEIIELTTSRTPWQLQEWEADAAIINQHMAISRDQDRYPMHTPSCAFCPFHRVCEKSTEAGMMAQLEMNYVVRPWDNSRMMEAEAT